MPESNSDSVSIINDLSMFAVDISWYLHARINKQGSFLLDILVLNIIHSTMSAAETHLQYAELLWIERCGSLSATRHQWLDSEIESSAKEAEGKITGFFEKLVDKCDGLTDDGFVYFLEKMLFSIFAIRAKVEIKRGVFAAAKELIEQCEHIIKKYVSDTKLVDELRHLKEDFAMLEIATVSEPKSSRKKKNKAVRVADVKNDKTMIEAGETVDIDRSHEDIVPPQELVGLEQKTIVAHKEKEKERRRLKKLNKVTKSNSLLSEGASAATLGAETCHPSVCSTDPNVVLAVHNDIEPTRIKNNVCQTVRLPKCYANNELIRNLINQMSENFSRSLCEGYLFGSVHYKTATLPNDFDVLLPNIKSDDDRKNVDDLMKQFELQGGVVTAMDGATGARGYKTGNRYVIPMRWKNWNIDFNVSDQDYDEHAQILDFTVGALYFNLRQKQMYHLPTLNSLRDVDRKRIHTISEPRISFERDPAQIFRAVRLIALEGFYLSKECDDAIQTVFSGDKNAFRNMKLGKLYQQLCLLCSQDHERKNMDTLHRLGFFL